MRVNLRLVLHTGIYVDDCEQSMDKQFDGKK